MKKLIIVLTIMFSPFLYAQKNGHDFISPMAIKPYTKYSGQMQIIKRYQLNSSDVHHYRTKAAKMAIQSGICDKVLQSDLVYDNQPEFEVICENQEIIYLNYKMLDNRDLTQVRSEKSKAISREVAKNRCIHQINKSVKKTLPNAQIEIDPYAISTWISQIGETEVRINYTLIKSNNNKTHFKAACRFHYAGDDSFSTTKL